MIDYKNVYTVVTDKIPSRGAVGLMGLQANVGVFKGGGCGGNMGGGLTPT